MASQLLLDLMDDGPTLLQLLDEIDVLVADGLLTQLVILLPDDSWPATDNVVSHIISHCRQPRPILLVLLLLPYWLKDYWPLLMIDYDGYYGIIVCNWYCYC